MTYDPIDPFRGDQIRWRVKKGVELLDDHYDQWANAIDLDELDMETTRFCVLGQLGVDTGDHTYNEMLDLLYSDWTGDQSESAQAHGFDTQVGEHYEAEYKALDREWARVIKERQNA